MNTWKALNTAPKYSVGFSDKHQSESGLDKALGENLATPGILYTTLQTVLDKPEIFDILCKHGSSIDVYNSK